MMKSLRNFQFQFQFQMRNALTASPTLRSSSPSLSSSPALFSSSSKQSRSAGAVADLAADDEDNLTFIRKSPPSVTVSTPNILQPRVVIFDGVCHLCHRGVKWVIRADKYGKIKFCCLQSKAAEPYLKLCDVEREDVLRRFIFIEGLGEYHQASTAALKVMSYLPFPYPALSSLLVIPTPLRDAVYDYVAKRRYDWFGKDKDCLVLKEPEMLDRFIDREEILTRRQSDI